MIRRLIQRFRPERDRPPFQDVIVIRVQNGLYDWSQELDGGVR